MLHMLDTDIASYIIKGHSPKIDEKLSELQPSDVCVSAITKAELLYGLKRIPENHRLHGEISRFFQIVRVLAWDAVAAEYYAGIRHQLVSTGQPIGELDMMIAAHSISVGAVLVSNNTRHYQRISGGLALANWAQLEV
ncbi:type II toxin-antitoxin system VapC family toxin [Phyllobacterium sp. UNC302MFCol5.2]|uniref:type II toxin-antitoxin system VapC family toxin n=1 Tax=Phyllobacterium sp. UNC302MFCol5.2 TaxID=1449065 RepID=UPI000487CEA3|nr:type II toxin-antitoxin system VapC family toxin [Phyllobacterium sp. UNC302MFCol5.2]